MIPIPDRFPHRRAIRLWQMFGFLILCHPGLALAQELPAPAPVDFVRDVRPIFEAHCYHCHGPDEQRSSFRLDRRSSALKGGDFGAAIVPGKSSESALVRFVAGEESGMEMPPDGDKLTAEQIGVLRRWIDAGATWPDEVAGEAAENPADWWAFHPISSPPIPDLVESDQARLRTPIDAFILSRLRQAGLEFSPEADRRTLIRRLTFDLHGLPPTPDEVEAFINDSDPNAYERLVDRLLQSEHYGERWARHWLDVAHYADSHGHDQDRIRPNAWPYRDYLIRAFNSDKPYAEFVAEQIAGDVISDDPAIIAATGFLAAGPFDESSLVSIQEDSIDRLIGQYLDRDDIVSSTMTTFVGLTAGCARCHDHKFDPIPQAEYYALQAVFAGTDKAERTYDMDPELGRRRQDLQGKLAQLEGWKGQAEPSLLTEERQAAAVAFEDSRTAAVAAWSVLEPAQWTAGEGTILKALLDRSVLAVGAAPERDTYVVTAHSQQKSITAIRLEVLTDETLPAQGPGRATNGNLHLTEFRIKAAPRNQPDQFTDVSLRSATADFEQANWDAAKTIDGNPATGWGINPAEGKPHEVVFAFATPVAFEEGATFRIELEQHHGRQHTIGRFRLSETSASSPQTVSPLPTAIAEIVDVVRDQRTDLQKAELARWLTQQQTEQELASLPPPSRVFCGTNQFKAEGTFRPAATPRPVHVLARGEVSKAGALAAPGTISAVAPLAAQFELAEPNDESQRRAALANWLSHPENPLTWRVIVNRVWHHHFGRGIVDTPSDFGRMGGEPSHPELLDWLSAEFRGGGGSLKELHRLIVTSSVYRQSSRHSPGAALIDADNRLLWRMNRQRLDAESVRDAVLVVSGRLNAEMYGPPVQQFVIQPGTEITPNADYESFDVDRPESRRRSVYRFVLRTRPDPLMDVLDCPDASQAAPVRSSSLSALQALALWNNAFTLRYAEHLAALVAADHGNVAEQVRAATERALSRPPTEEESAAWTDYATRHGLANFCRVLLNSSEFLFVD